MSLKFEKNRSVDFRYHAIPLMYTGIKHRNNADKELVLIDDLKKTYVAAYRNNKLNKVGRHFILKKTIENKRVGFVHRGKFHPLGKYGWVL